MSSNTIPNNLQPNTSPARFSTLGLPVRRKLTLAFALSIVIAILMLALSVVSLIYRSSIYPTDGLFLAFGPSDMFNLIGGVPILLGSMWLAQRGKLIGLLCWPGALFYVLYIYFPYLLGVPFNFLSLLYLILIIFSAYTLIGLIASIDGERVRQQLTGLVPRRTAAGILIGLSVFILFRQSAVIITVLTNEAPVKAIEFATWVADFAIAVPMMLVGGIQLWRQEGLGYTVGAGLLMGYSLLALSLVPFFVLQARLTHVPIDLAGVTAIVIMAAVCLIPLIFFVRGASANRARLPSSPPEAATGETTG